NLSSAARLHPEVHLPRRHAAVATTARRSVPQGRAQDRRALQLRPGLCAYLGDVARPLRRSRRSDLGTRLRRANPSPVALLPSLLRGRLLDRPHGRFASPLQASITVANDKPLRQGAANWGGEQVGTG